MIRRIRKFFETDLWQRDLRQTRGVRKLWLAVLRIASHLLVSFSRSLGSLKASGLTLVTLLSLVPTLVLVFAIANAFGADYAQRVEDLFLGFGDELPPGMHAVKDQIHELVERTSFGALGVMGSAAMIWTAYVLFAKVEQAFNSVWRTRGRGWLRRITDFVAVVVLVPPLVLGALFSESLLASSELTQELRDYWGIGSLYSASLGFIPYLMLWLAFTCLYRLMPSAPVRWRDAAAGALVAAVGWTALHRLYIEFQFGVAQANAIYATLAALPLLLVYLQLVWTLVLVGAEVSYAVHHIHDLRGAEALPDANWAVRKRLAWHLMREAGDRFRKGDRGCDLGALSGQLDVPREWLDDVAKALAHENLVVMSQGDDLAVPARPPEDISMAEVFAAADWSEASAFLDRVTLPAEAEQRVADADTEAARLLQSQRL